MPSSMLVSYFCCSVIHLHTFLMFFTLVYLIFIAAYLIAFTVALRMRTYEENGVAHEAIVIEWAVSSAS